MLTQLGLDLGNSSIIGCTSDKKISYVEPAVICTDRTSGALVAVGSAAQALFKQNPSLYYAFRPFSKSLVEDINITKAVLKMALEKGHHPSETELLIAVPMDFSSMQEELLCGAADLVEFVGCRLVYSPLAAMVGTFTQLPKNFISVDIGATRTNILVVSNRTIVYTKSLCVGGNSFDEAIVNFYLKNHKVHLSLQTAEHIKKNIASVWDYETEHIMKVPVKHGNKSLSFEISSRDLYSALLQPISSILEALCFAVSKIPIESVRATFDVGIQLSGGGALLSGLDSMIEGVTGVHTVLVDDPLQCVSKGLGIILSKLSPSIPQNYRNISSIYLKQINS